jgi:hypothetical protein
MSFQDTKQRMNAQKEKESSSSMCKQQIRDEKQKGGKKECVKKQINKQTNEF